ncbi:acyltransferase [uncultured Parabacteroides sp.]|uniref:acyltransferase n=1 Tax=uncultured Parabacteroides sp. TaxID=512312 RepID=UPI0034654DDC
MGNKVKIQDNVMVPHGVTIEDGVFIGPGVAFTNDKWPRSITEKGELKTSTDWECTKTLVKYGASIGANATIVCGITIGEWAMIGAGAVVTKDVPAHALVIGNPAHIVRQKKI